MPISLEIHGAVARPRFDLGNQELIEAHLHRRPGEFLVGTGTATFPAMTSSSVFEMMQSLKPCAFSSPSASTTSGKGGILEMPDVNFWRGDRDARAKTTTKNNRLSPVFEALAAVNISAEPAVYSDEMVDEVRDQLLRLDGVLVWVDPISEGHDRSKLDPMLREVAAKGVWVSAHPDVILKMGTKEVLFRTRHLGCGTETYLYRAVDELRTELPLRLTSGPRVLKQNRGNGGIGTWKVELPAHGISKVGPDRIRSCACCTPAEAA
jgi:hypothetical protein